VLPHPLSLRFDHRALTLASQSLAMTNGADRPLPVSPESSATDPATDDTALDRDLPAFTKPPVVEVAASLQFEPVDGLHPVRLGLLWGAYRDRYPQVEVQPPLSDTREVIGPPVAPRLSFRVETAPPALRYWFLNDRGTRMLQVQQTRFILNWRKMDTEEVYPHYPEIRQNLVDEYAHFERFLDAESLPRPGFNQVELTYVNHVPVSPGAARLAVQRIVRLWRGEPEDSVVPVAEDVSFQVRYVMPSMESPLGRLYVTLETRYRLTDNVPVLVLQMVARGAPEGPGLAGALAFMDRGHRWIVQSFAAITTPEMHHVWERTQ
jgi:uncharacterized protein (TIGR04255 family)